MYRIVTGPLCQYQNISSHALEHATLCPFPPSSLSLTPRPRTNAILDLIRKRSTPLRSEWRRTEQAVDFGIWQTHLESLTTFWHSCHNVTEGHIEKPLQTHSQFATVLWMLRCYHAPGRHWSPFLCCQTLPGKGNWHAISNRGNWEGEDQGAV